MASLLPGYNYDIFISYRQKDNKGDRWVSEFVEALKTELESTFKEEISVYFDINPHDGLLETHDVDDSLKEKLKCLIFIPIISRTYCDPKSFAWEHELKAFVEHASKDLLGLKVKLQNGNVASRVLPIQIHDIDSEDKKLCETVLGGFMRGIEFIYKEPGVDRSLTANDNEEKNLNKTNYRNQVNKVALSIKEIISAVKQQKQIPAADQEEASAVYEKRSNNAGKKILAGSSLALLVIIIGILFIQRLFLPSENIQKSIAVLPFKNDSPDTTNQYFIDGTMDAILSGLSQIKDLDKVTPRTSVEQFRNTKHTIPEIAKILNVNYILEGSGQKYGNILTLRVQLIAGDNEKHIWGNSYEEEIKEVKDYIRIQSHIAQSVADELKAAITPQEKLIINQIPTDNKEALNYYLRGNQSYSYNAVSDFTAEMYTKAIELDPDFTLAYLGRANVYSTIFGLKSGGTSNWVGKDTLAKRDLEKALSIESDLPAVKLAQALMLYRIEGDNEKALKLLNEIKPQMANNSDLLFMRGALLRRNGLWKESMQEMASASQLDPLRGQLYIELGRSYMWIRKYQEALYYFNKPDSLSLGENDEARSLKLYASILWTGNIISELETSKFQNTITDYYFSRQFKSMIPFAKARESQFEYCPGTLDLANIYYLSKDKELSKLYADSAIMELELKVKNFTDDDRYIAALGYAYALKGDERNALGSAIKAAELRALKNDAMGGFIRELDLAKVYILTGKYDLAMDKLEYLLTIPGELSVMLLKIDPFYDNLRDLPRFKKILETEYITIYH